LILKESILADTENQVINEKLIEDVKSAIKDQDHRSLGSLISEMRPADAADLVEQLNSDERLFLFDILEPEGAGNVLIEIESPVQVRIISDLDNKVITEIVQELDSDDAADLVGDLPAERAKEIIEVLDDEVSQELEKLLPYEADTAGGIMALEFVAVKSRMTIEEAVNSIREKREEVDNIYYLWVVNDAGKLAGVVSLKDLVLESPRTIIADIMNPEVISVNVHRDQEEIYHIVKKYDLVVVPVVDDDNRLVGRITHDDILDVVEEEADEDIAHMAGVIGQEVAEESPLKISRARLPWLIAGLFGGIIAAVVIDQFESSLEKIIALAFFFPVVMAMGGNAGTQAATVAVGGLVTGDIGLMHIGKRLMTEMTVALLNGVICGVLLGCIVGIWLGDFGLGVVVAISLILIILISGFIGAGVPLVLKRFNVDPALATGPFVTTSNDILSLLIYLGLATLFLQMTA
jgi:magnesium transporter